MPHYCNLPYEYNTQNNTPWDDFPRRFSPKIREAHTTTKMVHTSEQINAWYSFYLGICTTTSRSASDTRNSHSRHIVLVSTCDQRSTDTRYSTWKKKMIFTWYQMFTDTRYLAQKSCFDTVPGFINIDGMFLLQKKSFCRRVEFYSSDKRFTPLFTHRYTRMIPGAVVLYTYSSSCGLRGAIYMDHRLAMAVTHRKQKECSTSKCDTTVYDTSTAEATHVFYYLVRF